MPDHHPPSYGPRAIWSDMTGFARFLVIFFAIGYALWFAKWLVS